MRLQVPGRSYTKYFSSFILIFAFLLFAILISWIYFSTSQAIKEQQRVSLDLNNRNSARVLDSKKEQLRVTLNQIAARYVWFAGRGGETSQQILNGIVNRDKEQFRLDMLRIISADQSREAVADSPFFDFQGVGEILKGSHEQHFGNARLVQVTGGKNKLWLIARGKKLIDPTSGKVLGVLFGGVVLNDNVPLCREMLKRSSGEYVSLAAENSIISSSSLLPTTVLDMLHGNPLISDTICIRSSPAELWQVSISPYEKTAGIPLYMIHVYKDTLQAQLRQTLLQSGGFVALLTIGMFFLFSRFFSGKTRQAISNLLNYTKTAVSNTEHNSYYPGSFREFNQIGIAVESMLHSLDEAAEKLVEAKEKAEAASHAKSVFLASMSHELRTPLNAILGYAQLMESDDTLSKKQRGNIHVMYKSGDHLLMLINDILDLSKIEAGKIGLVEKEFSLAPFFSGIVDIIQVRSREKGLRFFYETPNVLPVTIVADELRLRQVVLNLLANAIKFTDKGFCSLTVESKPIDSENVQLTISVVDTGPGVSPLMQGKIFDPFQQSGERLKYSEGAGLGLAISRRLITEMGSKIDLISPVRQNPSPGQGAGSCFSFVLDVKSSGMEVITTETNHVVTGYRCQDPAKEKTVKILIVDDQLTNRKVLKDSLEPLGFITEEANDGYEVASICSDFRPDLILMDLQMPKMDGLEATRMLKAVERFSEIPVVAITAAVTDTCQQSHEDLADDGFCDCIYKPYQLNELLGVLAEHLHLKLLKDKTNVEKEIEEDLMAPPESVLKQIMKFTDLGDINRLETMAREIKEMESGEYYLFAERLADLVENIQLSRIQKMITTLLER
jgi:signal transduction histidine kinase/FixJ family two-component response regulator